MNAKISVFFFCVEAIIYLLLYKLHHCTFKLCMDGVKLKATEPLRGDSLLFTTRSPGIPGTYLIDLGVSQPWSHLVVLNLGPLDWEY